MRPPTEVERIIFATIKKHGACSVTDVMHFSGLQSYQHTLRRLNMLTEQGYLLCNRDWKGGSVPKVWKAVLGQSMSMEPPPTVNRPAKQGPVPDAANGLAGLVHQMTRGA